MTGTSLRSRNRRQTSVPGKPGKHQVEQNEVGAVALEFFKPGRPGCRGAYFEAFTREHVGECFGERLLIFDDEQVCHDSLPL